MENLQEESHPGSEGEEEKMMQIEKQLQGSVRKRHLPVDNTHSLETKFAREAEKIIKLRVTADAVNWELKERLKSLEAIKDHQQQNLVKQQMEYESLDMRLQNELRNREHLINKISNTRKICSAVESHTSSAIGTLANCEQDRDTLSKGYEMAAITINAVKEQCQDFQRRQKLRLRALEDKYTGEVRINKVSEEKWVTQAKQNEEMIEQLRKQNDIQANLNNVHIQEIEEVTTENEKIKLCLMQKTKEIAFLNAQHTLFKENSSQQIMDLSIKLKENSILTLTKEKEVDQINLLLTEERDSNDKLRETENLMKKNYEETMIQLQLVETSYRKQSDEKLAFEMKANSEMETKLQEYNILSEKFYDSQRALESLLERYGEANKKLEESEMEVEKGQKKYDEDMSALRAALTSVTLELNENVKVIAVANDEIRKKDESLSSMSDTTNSLMSQLKASTDARGKVEMANQQMKQEFHIFKELHKEKEAINEQRYNLFTEDYEKVKKLCDAKILECGNLIEMNTSLKKDLAAQKTYNFETKKVPDIKSDGKFISRTPDIAHVESSTTETVSKSNPVSVKKKEDSILNFTHLKISRNQTAKKTVNMDSFLSDSSFDGFVYDMNFVKQHYSKMTGSSEQPNSTTRPLSDHLSQERESKIPKKKKNFSFVKTQQNK